MSRVRLAELACLLACLAFFWMAFAPLGAPEAAAGMDMRFAAQVPSGQTAEQGAAGPDVSSLQRAGRLQAHLAAYLCVAAGAGWIALAIARWRLPWTIHAALMVPLWCAVAAGCGVFNWPPGRWLAIGAAAAAAALLTGAVLGRQAGRGARAIEARVVSAWRYPGFVLLCGVGLAWLSDLSARGAGKQFLLGLHQADSVLLAVAVFTLAAALAPALLQGLSRGATGLEDRLRALPRAGAVACIVALLAVPLFALVAAVRVGVVTPSMFGELARLPSWVVCGWVMYRWVDRDRPSAWGFVLVLASQAMLLAAYALGDKGQAMVMLLSMCVPFSVLVVPMLLARGVPIARTRGARALIAGLVWLPFVAAVLMAIWTLGPRLGSHIAERLEAIRAPFAAGNDFLAQLYWLSHAAGTTGFGLAHVPWCGNLGSLGAVCHGVPQQIQSDYAIQGIAAVWGLPVAVVLVMALCAWLLGMARLDSREAVRARSPLALRAWILAFFAVMLATQAMVTSFGALGAMPMTGVPLPLLAYGRTGLLVVSFFAGLSMHRWAESPAIPSTPSIQGAKHV